MSKPRFVMLAGMYMEIVVGFFKFVLKKIFITTKNKSNRLSNFMASKFTAVKQYSFLSSLNFSP